MQADSRAGAQSEETGESTSLALTIVAHLLAAAFIAIAAFALWIWLDGPIQIAASALPFGLARVNPILWLPGIGLAWCAVRWRRWRQWFGLRHGHRLAPGNVHLLAWPVMLLSIGLLGAQLSSFTWQVLPIAHKVRKSARVGPGGMALNVSNRHAGPLVRNLIRRPTAEPIVVWINDHDKRGHSAAFYLYPRLMLMEPKLRRWSVQERMGGLGGPNPLFSVGIRPSKKLSEEFADARGAKLVFARKPSSGEKP